MNERTIQCALWAMVSVRSEVVMPNFTPLGWWECDVWACTKAGFGVEYEIKLTRSDFKADAQKVKEDYVWKDGKRERGPDGWLLRETLNKHDRLAMADERGPSRFYYVTPPDLLQPGDLPPWAGHIVFNPLNPVYRATSIEVDAPRLHRKKVEQAVKVQAWRAGYYRFWRQRETLALKGQTEVPERKSCTASEIP